MCSRSVPGVGLDAAKTALFQDSERLKQAQSPVPPRIGTGGQGMLNVGFICIWLGVISSLSAVAHSNATQSSSGPQVLH